MRKTPLIAAAIVLLCLGANAHADVFNLSPGLTSLETVTVGDVRNMADTQDINDGTTGYGSVSYIYSIGKYEVTTAQYCDFLNHKAATDIYGFYNPAMQDRPNGCRIQREETDGSYTYSVASDWANTPVNYVSYWDACRFTNWLNNGQGDGDTETGAYTLDGYNGSDGSWIQRNTGAHWAVASEDEWYKAAYYKGGGTSAGYWDYPTQSNSINTSVANYNDSVGCTAAVGSYDFSSAYGTYDQGGNVWEWNETAYPGPAENVFRGSHGGSYGGLSDYLSASYSAGAEACWEDCGIGFRVVQLVPEPTSLLALAAGVTLLAPCIRRRM